MDKESFDTIISLATIVSTTTSRALYRMKSTTSPSPLPPALLFAVMNPPSGISSGRNHATLTDEQPPTAAELLDEAINLVDATSRCNT